MKVSAPHHIRAKIDWFPYVMCFPALLLFFAFTLAPFITGFWTSLHIWDGFGEMSWAGSKNYYFSFTDLVFWQAMGNTFVYAVSVTVIKNIIALTVAFVLVKKFFGRTVLRTGIYLPVTLSYVVIGVLWIWIYNPTFGLFNSLLRAAKLDKFIVGWLSDPDYAMASVVVVDVWKWIGYHMVLYVAGLQAIPKELYEAADIDGASPLSKLLRVTLPQLNSTLVVNFLMSITGGFVANFDIVNIMTGGGPMHRTEVSLTYIMSTAFKYGQMGKANAMSMILFVFVFIFGFVQLRIMTREDVYE